MRKPLAICCKISALGRRSPRSTWLRYGLEIPAAEASWRSEIFACSRCWRMYSPMELTLTGLTLPVNHRVLAIASGQLAPPQGRPPGAWPEAQDRADVPDRPAA